MSEGETSDHDVSEAIALQKKWFAQEIEKTNNKIKEMTLQRKKVVSERVTLTARHNAFLKSIGEKPISNPKVRKKKA